MINLIQHARGLNEGWYSAQLLDDQPDTVLAERTELGESGIENDLQERSPEFFSSLLRWMHERNRKEPDAKAETRRVLVVDMNLKGVTDLRAIGDVHGVGLPLEEDTRTDNGRKAGLVLVDMILRNSPRFRKLPIVILSAYGMDGWEKRWERIKERPGAPVHYLKKAVVTDQSAAKDFKEVVEELLHDERLLFVQKLANFWELNGDQVCGMLGVRKHDTKLIAQLFDRGRYYPNEDADQRVRLLMTIHENLYSLMRDRDTIRGWLKTRCKELGRAKPVDLVASCDFERLAIVKHHVDFLCMR